MIFNANNEECVKIKGVDVSINAVAQALKLHGIYSQDEFMMLMGVPYNTRNVAILFSEVHSIIPWDNRTTKERNHAKKIIKRLFELRVFDREQTAYNVWKGISK